MRFGSVCSGIEAASVAWTPLGWKAAWLSEIEPFPCAVLAHHYPDVPNHGDMTTLPKRILLGEVEAPDLFCGGTPCQAFSVAGLRQSLDDARGNLSLIFCEIADAIDHVRSARGEQPAIIFWENVPGVLSTKDNAFGCFLAGLAGEDDPLVAPGGRWANSGCVYGPQRAVAWRTLDAQYFGLAQRRRRVFVIASARDGFDPSEVLFEWDGVRRDTAPRREAGEEVTPTIRAGAPNGGAGHGARSGDSKDELIVPVAHSLRGEGFDASEDGTGRGTPLVPVTVGTLAANTGPNGHDAGNFACNQAVDAGHVLAVPIQECMVSRANMNGTGTGIGVDGDPMFTLQAAQPHGVAYGIRTANTSSNDWGIQENVTHTLDQAMGVAVAQPVAFAQNSRDEVRLMNGDGQIVGALAAEPGMKQTCYVAQPVGVTIHGADPTVQKVASYDDLAQCLRARTPCNIDNSSTTVVQQPVGAQMSVPQVDFDLNQTLQAKNPMAVAVSLRGREGGATAELGDEVGNCLRASSGGGDKAHVLAAMSVRRLTPVECERLQGFPDNYTQIPWRKKPAEECPDGPRYKALGNSWATPVVQWIGRRIKASLEKNK